MLTQGIAKTAMPFTTTLSTAWLKSAGRGEAGILWHQFFDALLVGRIGNPTYSTGIQEAMDNLFAAGDTLGADALAGFIGVFVSGMEATGSWYG